MPKVLETYRFDCPHCKGRFRITSEQFGEKVACPHCSKVTTIPLGAVCELPPAGKVDIVTDDELPLSHNQSQNVAGQNVAGQNVAGQNVVGLSSDADWEMLDRQRVVVGLSSDDWEMLDRGIAWVVLLAMRVLTLIFFVQGIRWTVSLWDAAGVLPGVLRNADTAYAMLKIWYLFFVWVVLTRHYRWLTGQKIG